MKVIALVPLKRNSERLKGKNIKPFCGLPLYHIIFSTLQKCDFVEKIVANVDCEEIAQDLQKHFSKVIIIKRPPHLLGEMVTMNTLIEYDITKVESNHFLQTHCTNPLLTENTLKEAISLYFNSLNSYDSLFSVSKIQSRLYREDNSPVNHNPTEMLRTQDMESIYQENSNLFIFSRQSFQKAGNNRIGLAPRRYIQNKIESVDIDYEEDFVLAELIYENRKSFGNYFPD